MAKIKKQNEEWYGPMPEQKQKLDPYTMTYSKYMRGLAPADSKTKKGWREPFTGIPAYVQMLDPTAVDTDESQMFQEEGSCLSRPYLDKQAAKKAVADATKLLKSLKIPVEFEKFPTRREKFGIPPLARD